MSADQLQTPVSDAEHRLDGERESEERAVSSYFQDLERRAKVLGVGLDQVQESDRRLLAEPLYPKDDCLKPDEVSRQVAGAMLAANRAAHLSACLYCQSLVLAAKPSEERMRRLAKRALDQGAVRPSPERRRQDWARLIERLIWGLSGAVVAPALIVLFGPALLRPPETSSVQPNVTIIDPEGKPVEDPAELMAAIKDGGDGNTMIVRFGTGEEREFAADFKLLGGRHDSSMPVPPAAAAPR